MINLRHMQHVFIKRIKHHCKTTHEHIYMLTPYINAHKPIKMLAVVCGFKYIFNYKPVQLRPNHFIFHKTQNIKTFHKRLINKERQTKEHIKQLTPYTKETQPIWFKCLDCGLKFKDTPNTISERKYICPNKKQEKKWTKSEVAKAIKHVTNGEYEINNHTSFINIHTKIGIIHKSKQCQYYKKYHKFGTFYMNFDSFYYSHHRCTFDHPHNKRKTTKQFAKEIDKLSHHRVKLISKYKRSNDNVCLECMNDNCPYYKKYGKRKKWTKRANEALNKPLCPVEYSRQRNQRYVLFNKHKLEHYIHNKMNNKYKILKYYPCTHNRTKLTSSHGLFEHCDKNCAYYKKYGQYFRWYTSTIDFRKFGCLYDNKIQRRKYFAKRFMKQIKLMTNDHYIVDRHSQYQYKTGDDPIVIIHKDKRCLFYKKHHQYFHFITTPHKFMHGVRCPYNSASKGELQTIQWLNIHNMIKVSNNKRYINKQNYKYGYILNYSPYTTGNQHFDFYLPKIKWSKNKYGIEIEFNGSQHFKPIVYFSEGKYNSNNAIQSDVMTNYTNEQLKDFAKRLYCKQYGILQININNPHDYENKKLTKIVTHTLNHKLLPILKQNHII